MSDLFPLATASAEPARAVTIGPRIHFVAYGLPRPAGSKKRMPNGAIVEEVKGLEGWRATVGAAGAAAMDRDRPGELFRRPVIAKYVFIFPRPKDHFRSDLRTLKPNAPRIACGAEGDLEKLIRAVNDAIQGVVIINDKFVGEIMEGTGKFYGDRARVEVTMQEAR